MITSSQTLVSVIIPIYKANLSNYEHVSLKQVTKILSQYPIIMVKPLSLNIENIKNMYPQIQEVSFLDEYFNGIKGYNRLMLSAQFYARFLHSKYLLIYHLDAYVFRDELEYWCQKNYDYIGAPWGPKYLSAIGQIKLRLLKWLALKEVKSCYKYLLSNRAGNGGFSLRNTGLFYDIILSLTANGELSPENPYTPNEDVFWSLEVNKKEQRVTTPPLKESLAFAIEHYPERAFQILGNTLPFGCHAWYKNPKWLSFWKKHIPLKNNSSI